jgi:hydrogenase/urease accessory protein HupE
MTANSVAHDSSISGLKVLLDKDGATVSVMTHMKDFGKADPKSGIVQQLFLVVNGKKWVCESPQILVDKPTDSITLQARISQPVESVEVTKRLFSTNPNSKTIVTIMKNGEAVGEGVLTSEFTSWTYGSVTKTSPSKVFLEFLSMGVRHILSGPDHILFIFGLMLARPRIKELLKVATAFTIAHSITLSLCALNIFTLPSRIVEPLIALSIVAVAAEKFLRPNDKVWRTVVIAFFFGLIHGFGFAGALTEAGLAAHQAALSLAAFNIGVEVVQVSLILVTIPILVWLADKRPKVYLPATTVCAVFISLAGAFWFVERVIRGS